MLETHGLVRFLMMFSDAYVPIVVRYAAGLMPISANKNETRKLFFWLFPSKDAEYTEDLV